MSNLQDELISKLISLASVNTSANTKSGETLNMIVDGLFMTLEPADDTAIQAQIDKISAALKDVDVKVFQGDSEDIKSLKSLLFFGLKGIAIYARKSRLMGQKDEEVDDFFYESLSAIARDLNAEELFPIVLHSGAVALKSMELLCKARPDSLSGFDASRVGEAIRKGNIRHIFAIMGRDSSQEGVSYYRELAKEAPKDTVILTFACNEHRFDDLNLGEIDGIARLSNLEQCGCAYDALQVAVGLSKALECTLEELPMSFFLSLYEQKAVCTLLALLYLGISSIHLGPALPDFISRNVFEMLVEKFDIMPTTAPGEDLWSILG
ncbi:hydroxylamine reductase [Candidatus Gastranaerophilus sp. (ex Termes propinquus)]|nr:hydroxylamine reductase [Candidatus Gastranaerophilus sp. (ex Termes propinquus)]